MEFFKFFVEGVCTALLGLFGIIGNVVSIKVLSSKELEMLPTFRHLLKMLAGFDATFLVFALTLFCFSSLSEYYDNFVRPWLLPFLLPLLQIALTGSVWTTTAVSLERYLTVCQGYRPTNIQYLYYTIPIMGFSLIFNIPHFFELTTQVGQHNTTHVDDLTGDIINVTIDKPIVIPTEIRKSPEYSRDYVLIANSLALIFIPMLVLIILNSLIYRTISQATKRHNAISSNQRRDHKVAMMLLTIVCFQMALYGKLKDWPNWIKMLVNINHFALVVNSSINILIYCFKDEKFLNVLLQTIGIRRHRFDNSLIIRRSPKDSNTHIQKQNMKPRSDTQELSKPKKSIFSSINAAAPSVNDSKHRENKSIITNLDESVEEDDHAV
ncbi:unnamed protein product [Lepeophtheirus salmonis]|uniref:(salmon louse) hypothetical protein n=1 Tax=Lepeophtheirus salmonis TaxID=72036 RepID=A0A7R8H9S0_LEPSM|nr:unnamed protein product [Lepeophtheirus salmonis]CAF2958964.1 unnamed protein product [Lepeophtheirus salmonis]